MGLSRSKSEKAKRAKRLSEVKRVYPHYPSGIWDAIVEARIREYLDGKRETWTAPPVQ
jgi:hypothetical protein